MNINKGDWTAHNIYLGEGAYTINKKLNYDTLKLRRVVQIISDLTGGHFDSLRILDLGSLEGLYTIELGLSGVREAVGIEGRDANLEKGEFSKDTLQIKNISFLKDDVRNLSEEKYGRFDIILCLGLLYHLDGASAFHLLAKMYDMCDKFLVIDTHIALKNDEKLEYRGVRYFGTYTKEFKKGISREKKLKRVWNALDNEKSFLFSKKSLLRALNIIGFTSIYECQVPFEYIKPEDRLTLIAIKGKKAKLKTYPPLNSLSEEDIRKAILATRPRSGPVSILKIGGRAIIDLTKLILFRYNKED